MDEHDNRPEDRKPTERRGPPIGASVVLIGVAGFVASCFLPYYSVSPPSPSRQNVFSLYQLSVNLAPGLTPRVAGAIWLFSGVAIIAWLAILCLRQRPPTWSVPALAAASAVWALWWFANLVRITALVVTRAVGFWSLLGSVAVVTTGTIISVVARKSQTASEPPST